MNIIRSAYAYILVGVISPLASFAAGNTVPSFLDPTLNGGTQFPGLNGSVGTGNTLSGTAQGNMGGGFDIITPKNPFAQQVLRDGFNGGGAKTSGNFKANGVLPNPLGVETVGQLVDKLSIALITVAVPVVTIMCLYGAFLIAKSGGSPTEIKKGQETIYYAALGFGLLLLAGGVTQIIQELFA